MFWIFFQSRLITSVAAVAVPSARTQPLREEYVYEFDDVVAACIRMDAQP
jgi:hypothetical protein